MSTLDGAPTEPEMDSRSTLLLLFGAPGSPSIKPEFGAQLLEHHLLKLGDNSISVKSRSKASPCWPSLRPPPSPGWAARGGIPLSLVHKEKVVRITLKSSPGSEN